MDSIFSRPMAWPGCRFLNGRQICPIYTVALGGSREKISSRASQLKIPRHSPFSKQKVKPIAVDAIGARIEDNYLVSQLIIESPANIVDRPPRSGPS